MDVEKMLRTLPNKQRRTLEVLAQGGKYSVADLCVRTHFSDPRSHIRSLRDKGVPIMDEWRENKQGDGRYKVYFLAQPQASTTANGKEVRP